MNAILTLSRLTAVRPRNGARPPLWRRLIATLTAHRPRQRGPTPCDLRALSPHLRRDLGLDTAPELFAAWSRARAECLIVAPTDQMPAAPRGEPPTRAAPVFLPRRLRRRPARQSSDSGLSVSVVLERQYKETQGSMP